MGQVAQSFEEAVDVVVVVEKEGRENEERKGNNKEGSTSTVRWERFLPRMGLRVLLVEADDSTRQIIAALLRKCSYKVLKSNDDWRFQLGCVFPIFTLCSSVFYSVEVYRAVEDECLLPGVPKQSVASVPDGLKAWEVLNARPHNIDLILTEVELPSISGYALLTLIMEQEICKNIPVIMMSTHDSVSMVYKCMLRGAADFLVKPIRINELKNLWQHVWRRQTDESVGQQKLEATAENDATSDHSSSSKACAARQEQCIKKGSDAQSSCRQADLEAESAEMAAEEEHNSQPKLGNSPVSDSKIQENNNCAASGQNLSIAFAGSEDNAVYNHNDTLDQGKRLEQNHVENLSPYTEGSNTRDVPATFPREPIDLVGALNSHSRHNSCLNDRANKSDSPQLDLSLRRLYPGVLESNTNCEKQLLNHSNASAFTRYVNKTLPPSTSNPTSASNSKEDRVNSGDHFSENAPGSNSSAQEPTVPHDGKLRSMAVENLTKAVENEYQNASQRLFPIPFPVRGVRVDVCASPIGYGSVTPPTVCTSSPSPSPSSANQHINSFHQFSVDVINGRHHCHPLPLDQSLRISSNQPINKQHQRLESLENRPPFSPAADQSATSTLCNSTAAHQDAVISGGFDSGNDQIQATCDLNLQRSIQREAALTKFRLKRKERCYEKKVRYESRKKLAEQRPRVKGQFVRQVPPDPPPQKSDNSGGTSAASQL